MNTERFHCARCGNCCRWPGAVKVDAREVDAIAEFLGMSLETFLAEHTALLKDRTGLTLLEKPDGSCEFLGFDEAHRAFCQIEKVKPSQCRKFPEKWNFPGWQKECKGILS